MAKKKRFGIDGWQAYNVQDKEQTALDNIDYTFLRVLQMFKINGLPDTMPEDYVKFYLLAGGNLIVSNKHDGEHLFGYQGGLGGEPDEWYRPTIATVANPAQKLSKSLKISWDGKTEGDCVVVKNDFFMKGLYPLIAKYASLMGENELSIWDAQILTRVISLISANTTATKDAADVYIKKIVAGELSAVYDDGFGGIDSLKSVPYASGRTDTILPLIELEQYLKGSLFNEIGLQSNWNAKRESIDSNESQLNEDMLYPLVDEMFRCWQEGFDAVNMMYGTNITVKKNSVWELKEVALEEEIDLIDGQDGDDIEDPTGDKKEPEEDDKEDKKDEDV